MITFNKMYKRIGGFILKDISFTIPDGCICGMVGRNGAGKTTILNLLLGLMNPDMGQITIDNMTYANREKDIRELLGFVIVDDLFIAQLSPKENGKYYGKYYDSYDNDMYLELLDRFGIKGRKCFGKLSRGQKLKCQFAFALSVKPKYLILDEPTANFDPDFHKDFWKLLSEFVADEKHSVLLATHLTDELDRMADKLLYVDEGQIIYEGDMEDFRSRYRVLSGDISLLKKIERKHVLDIYEGKYSTTALVGKDASYSDELVSSSPTIEDFMIHFQHGKELGYYGTYEEAM